MAVTGAVTIVATARGRIRRVGFTSGLEEVSFAEEFDRMVATDFGDLGPADPPSRHAGGAATERSARGCRLPGVWHALRAAR